MTYSTRLSATNASPSISSANFGFLCRTIYDDSGIVLDQSKMYLVQARLTPLASSEEFKTLDDLCDLIRAVGGRRIRDRVVDAMTTNETLLFREGRPFDALREKIIPELTSRQSDRTLRIWSATCSTGQEAYSIAMIWRELDIAGWSMRLVGTDLSASVLDQARQGRYHQHEVKRGLPPDYLEKYFDAEGTDWTIKPEIRAMVEWEKFNLRDSMAAMEPFDIILCRNVLIYFDDETKGRILENLRRALKPGGYLLLGSTESTLSTNSRFKRLAVGSANAYQSIAAGW